MHAQVFLAALLASTAHAAPRLWTPHRAYPVVRQAPEEQAGVYVCEHHNWGGKCEHKFSPLGSAPEDCTTLDGTASSVGPDQGFYCIFYTNALCSATASDGSDSLTLKYPGTSNLIRTDKGNFNDKLLSYHCFKNEGEQPPAESPTVPIETPPVESPPVESPPVESPPVETPSPTVPIETPPVESPTGAPTDTLTGAPAPTDSPTPIEPPVSPTDAPVESPTDAPVESPTDAPIESPAESVTIPVVTEPVPAETPPAAEPSDVPPFRK